MANDYNDGTWQPLMVQGSSGKPVRAGAYPVGWPGKFPAGTSRLTAALSGSAGKHYIKMPQGGLVECWDHGNDWTPSPGKVSVVTLSNDDGYCPKLNPDGSPNGPDPQPFTFYKSLNYATTRAAVEAGADAAWAAIGQTRPV